jgi:hypothetical protein
MPRSRLGLAGLVNGGREGHIVGVRYYNLANANASSITHVVNRLKATPHKSCWCCSVSNRSRSFTSQL